MSTNSYSKVCALLKKPAGEAADVGKITERVVEWFYSESETTQQMFRDCEENQLIHFHHTLGQDIRNRFHLWSYMWTPEIVDGVDVSEHHPDAISMKVIRNVWEIVNR